MSTTFTQAAVERIAQCVGAVALESEPAAQRILTSYLADTAPLHGLRDYPFGISFSKFAFFNKWRTPRLYAFAELLEIGVAAGYIDIADMDDTERLRDALTRFCERELTSDEPCDLTLVVQLLDRLNGKSPSRVEALDHCAFHGYAAYLCLMERSLNDRDFYGFVQRSNAKWSPGDDLAFLLSPRHFAEALVKGRIGWLETRDVAGGLCAMEYLVALDSFGMRAANVTGLYEKALRHARWSHRINVMRRRFRLWHERMGEWLGAEPDEASISWNFNMEILDRLEAQLQHLDLVVASPAPSENDVKNTETPNDLCDQGRWGAAIHALRIELERRKMSMKNSEDESEWKRDFYQYVDACLQLAKLRKVDEAAAWLAQVEMQLTSDQSLLPEMLRQSAFAVLGEARGRLAPSAQSEVLQRQEGHLPEPAPSTQKELRMGGDTSQQW